MKTLIQKFGFDTSARPPIYCEQSLVQIDGGVEHYVDNVLRCTVPDSSVVAYINQPNIIQFLTPSEFDDLVQRYQTL